MSLDSRKSVADALGIYNVRDRGAKGDGTTIDYTAINNSVIAANAAGGGTVYLPPGTYQINQTLDLKGKVTLHLEPGAELRSSVDHDMVWVRPDCRVTGGGSIRNTNATYSKALILLDPDITGTNYYDRTDIPTGASDISLYGPQEGSWPVARTGGAGIRLRIQSAATSGAYIQWTQFQNITIGGIQYGVHLDKQDNGNGWINGNTFRDIKTEWLHQTLKIYTKLDQTGASCSANRFDSFEIQSQGQNVGDTEAAIWNEGGQNNRFTNWTLWDWYPPAIAVYFGGTATLNYLSSNIHHTAIFDSTSGGNIIEPLRPRGTELTWSRGMAHHPLSGGHPCNPGANSDNIAAYAQERGWTATKISGPTTSGDIYDAFRPSAKNSNAINHTETAWDGAGVPYVYEIKPLSAIPSFYGLGVDYRWGANSWNTDVWVSYYDTGVTSSNWDASLVILDLNDPAGATNDYYNTAPSGYSTYWIEIKTGPAAGQIRKIINTTGGPPATVQVETPFSVDPGTGAEYVIWRILTDENHHSGSLSQGASFYIQCQAGMTSNVVRLRLSFLKHWSSTYNYSRGDITDHKYDAGGPSEYWKCWMARNDNVGSEPSSTNTDWIEVSGAVSSAFGINRIYLLGPHYDTSTHVFMDAMALGYNVKDFGAKGDGTTDDTAAFVAAWAAATNGSTIYVPSGTYRVNPPAGLVLSSLSDVTVYGQGTIKATGKPTLGSPVGTNRTVLVEFISCTRVTVSGLTFDMNSIASGAVGLQACTDSVVEGCEVYGSGGVTAGEYALIACAGSHNTFRNNYIHDDVAGSTSHAIGWGGVTSQVGQDETYGQIIGNRCDTLDATAIVLTGTHCVATGNVCVNNRTGGGIISACTLTNDNRAENHVITGNYCARNNFHGYQTDCWPITPGPSGIARNITVSGNTFVNCKSGGMLINAAEDVTITGNTIINDDAAYALTGNAGITLNQASEDLRRVTIADNTIKFTATGMTNAYGIKMQGTQNVTYLFEDISIRGNQILLNKTAGYRGIHLLDAFDGQVYNRVAIENNNIRSCDYGVFVHSDYANGEMNDLHVVGNRVTDVLTNAFYFRAEDTTNIQDAVVTGNQTDGTLYSGSQSGNVRFVRNYGNSWNAGIVDGVYNVKDFGAKGDGTTDDTAAVNAALAAATSGGTVYFPAGTYKIQRGDAVTAPIADNILGNNIVIEGCGPESQIVSLTAAGTTPDNVGNQHYAVFSGTGRSNVTIRNLSFSGYCSPVVLYSSSRITVENIYDNAQLTNTGKYMRDKSVYVHQCDDVRVLNSTFHNFQFGVYVSGDDTTRSTNVAVSDCTFEHTTAADQYTTLFPVGVYWYFADNCRVTDCTFKNIYSSLDDGDRGTGMGYGVYEGDGTALGSGLIANNMFIFEPKQGAGGDKRAHGIFSGRMSDLTISGNTFRALSEGGNQAALMVAIMTRVYPAQDTLYTITGNTILMDDLASEKRGIWHYVPDNFSGTLTTVATLNITGNTVKGAKNGIYLYGYNIEYPIIVGNVVEDCEEGIRVQGVVGSPVLGPQIANNNLINCSVEYLYLPEYVTGARAGTVDGVFNVKDYGARGDNATNDTAAIQACIDAAEALGGWTKVYFPAGTYLHTGLTINKDGIVLCGPSGSVGAAQQSVTGGATLRHMALSNGAVGIKFQQPTGSPPPPLYLCGLEWLGIDTESGTAAVYYSTSVELHDFSSFRIYGCYIRNSRNTSRDNIALRTYGREFLYVGYSKIVGNVPIRISGNSNSTDPNIDCDGFVFDNCYVFTGNTVPNTFKSALWLLDGDINVKKLSIKNLGFIEGQYGIYWVSSAVHAEDSYLIELENIHSEQGYADHWDVYIDLTQASNTKVLKHLKWTGGMYAGPVGANTTERHGVFARGAVQISLRDLHGFGTVSSRNVILNASDVALGYFDTPNPGFNVLPTVGEILTGTGGNNPSAQVVRPPVGTTASGTLYLRHVRGTFNTNQQVTGDRGAVFYATGAAFAADSGVTTGVRLENISAAPYGNIVAVEDMTAESVQLRDNTNEDPMSAVYVGYGGGSNNDNLPTSIKIMQFSFDSAQAAGTAVTRRYLPDKARVIWVALAGPFSGQVDIGLVDAGNAWILNDQAGAGVYTPANPGSTVTGRQQIRAGQGASAGTGTCYCTVAYI